MPTISIIIPTFNRGNNVINTIYSIFRNSYKKIEIIVIEQGSSYAFKNHEYLLKDRRLKYLKLNKPNASKAKNLGIQKSKGRYLAFTDDDCVATTNWLNNILLTFKKNHSVDAIFGSVYEYKPRLHKNQVCPSTYKQKHDRLILKPEYHKDHLGFGNNLIVKKESLSKFGYFKEWLGPGSIGHAAEDAELALRILLKGGQIIYSHKVKIKHNKWLNPSEMGRLMFRYNCGEIACYGYLYLMGNNFAKKIINTSFFKINKQLRINILKYKKFGLKRYLIVETLNIFINIAYMLKGLLVAIYTILLSKINRILKFQNIINDFV